MKNIATLFTLLLITSLGTQAFSNEPFDGGDGTTHNPYQVATAQQLDSVRNYLDAHFIQTNHIDFRDYLSGDYWIPIGGNGSHKAFTGSYDGEGYVISNLTIARPAINNIGLFGHIGHSTKTTLLRNIHLENVNIYGGIATGALVGRVTGNHKTRIENCSVAGGTVRGDAAVGGLVGSNNSYISNGPAAETFRPVIHNSSSQVTVTLRSEFSQGKTLLGGLVGSNQRGMISNSWAMGAVEVDYEGASRVGGLTGCIESRGILVNSYSTASVSVHEETIQAGGLTGMDGYGRNKGIIIHSYWNTDSLETTHNNLGKGLSTTQMQSASNYETWDFTNLWQLDVNENQHFPYTQDQTTPKENNVYTWTGNANSTWKNANNWDQEGYPVKGDNILIPNNTSNYPNAPQPGIEVHNLSFEEGAQLNIEEGASITVTGSLSTNSTLPMPEITGNGNFILQGNEFQTIPSIVFQNLTIINLDNVELEGTITVNGLLEMETGFLDLNGFDIDLGTSGHITEWEEDNISSRIFGNEGVIRTNRDLGTPQGDDIAGLGMKITTSQDLGFTTIERGHSQLSGGEESKSILRWFDISPGTNENLDATLVFHYWIAEMGTLAEEQNNFTLFKRTDDESPWEWIDSELSTQELSLTATGIDEFSTWTAGSSDNPLPIVLLSFEGRAQNNKVELKWITAAEINNDYFTIERSTDGYWFEEITHIQGAGTTSQSKTYSYNDTDPVAGVAYYRLKQTDFNGAYEYAEIITVKTSLSSQADDYRVFPNPSQGNFNIMSNRDKATEIRIFDMQGRQMFTGNLEANGISRFELPQLQQGIYTIVFYGYETFTEKIKVF